MQYVKKRKLNLYTLTTPIDVLRLKMNTYNKDAKAILETLLTSCQQLKDSVGATPQLLTNIKGLYTLMEKADQIAIDCAHKLAPYINPKLESIEVKSQVEHRYVIKGPSKINTVDEWMRITGAQQAKLGEVNKKEPELQPIVPSIHDFEDDDNYEPETERTLN